jgi:dihydroxyacetone kinase-like protein
LAIADTMTAAIVEDLGSSRAAEALLVVNGFGGTPLIELYLMYNAARRMLERRGLRVTRSLSAISSLRLKWLDVRSP